MIRPGNELENARGAPGLTLLALALVAILLGANATWNWLFFRERDLWLSTIFYVPYAAVRSHLLLSFFGSVVGCFTGTFYTLLTLPMPRGGGSVSGV